MADQPKKLRVQFDFATEAYEELTALEAKVQAQSKAEVVRFALRSLQWLTETIQNGHKILVDDNKGGVREVIFPFILPKKPTA